MFDDESEAPRRLDPNAPRATLHPRPEGRGCIATCPICKQNHAFTEKIGGRKIIQYRCRCGAEPVFNAWDVPKLYEENRVEESPQNQKRRKSK